MCLCFSPPQDMSSLMHTIYDVVDASLSHPPSSHCKTLRVKLTVTPSPGVRRREPCASGTGACGGGGEASYICSLQHERLGFKSHHRVPIDSKHQCTSTAYIQMFSIYSISRCSAYTVYTVYPDVQYTPLHRCTHSSLFVMPHLFHVSHNVMNKRDHKFNTL